MKMKGILYGLGVGPGDPELLTLKAVRILKEADVIAVPDPTGTGGEKTALRIVEQYIQGKPQLLCPTPMLRDRSVVERCYDQSAGEIKALLDEGKTVAFITLGDPTVYSTYMYIHRRVLEKGGDAQLVPGVPSFCAVAARLNTSLCEGKESLTIIPASHDAERFLDAPGNKVFMKGGRAVPELIARLEERDMLSHAAMVANCGMDNEQVWPDLRAERPAGGGYFSIVLVKEA